MLKKLRQAPLALAMWLVVLLFGAALVGMAPFAGHASKLAILYAQPEGAFWQTPWVAQGRVLFVGLYLALTAYYGLRFCLGFGYALVGGFKNYPGLWAVVLGLVPFLFWEPIALANPSNLVYYPSPHFPEVVLYGALVASFFWLTRKAGPAAVAYPSGLRTFWGRVIVGIAGLVKHFSHGVSFLDALLTNFWVQLANAQVVLAWFLEQTERAAIVGIRIVASIAIMPLRWLVDTQGRLEPNRMIWTALAAALVVLWIIV